MSEVKERQVAQVKTTGEFVFVLNIAPPLDGKPPLVQVRVPRATQDGIQHFEDHFFLDELETPIERMSAEFDLALQVHAQKVETKRKAAEQISQAQDLVLPVTATN